MPVARPVLFLSAARADVIAAQDWYEGLSADLATRFRAELDRTVQRIAENALQFPPVLAGVRRALMHQFPYSLLFRIDPDAITVVACFHSSRDPEQWQRRIRE